MMATSNIITVGHNPPHMDYKDEDWLRDRYWGDNLSAADMAELAECSDETILRYMREYGIPRRDMSSAVSYGKRRQHGEYVPFRTHDRGYEYWRGTFKGEDEGRVAIHRLASVAWYGFDAVKDNVVHHENNIPWDNREDNLSVMATSEHATHHEPWEYSDVNQPSN